MSGIDRAAYRYKMAGTFRRTRIGRGRSRTQ